MKTLTLAAALALLLAPAAYAWDGTNTGSGQLVEQGAAAQSRAASAARASSTAGATATGGRATATGGRSTATGGRGGSVNIGSVGAGGGSGGGSGGGVASVVTVPEGYGNAPCGGGIGLGGAGGFGGGSGGGTLWEFGDCKRLRESAALRSLGYPDAALAELCQIDRVREAFGGKCPNAAEPIASRNIYPNDWCGTRNAGDKNQHLECDKVR